MADHEHAHHQQATGGNFWSSRSGLVLLAFLAMGGVLLFTEHRAHLLSYLPFLFILACPLLHMFAHGGHGAHRHSRNEADQTRRGSTGT